MLRLPLQDERLASTITLYFQRPGITFDALVAVSVQTTGITASVIDLTTNQTTMINPAAVHTSGRQVSLKINPALLPTPAGEVDLPPLASQQPGHDPPTQQRERCRQLHSRERCRPHRCHRTFSLRRVIGHDPPTQQRERCRQLHSRERCRPHRCHRTFSLRRVIFLANDPSSKR